MTDDETPDAAPTAEAPAAWDFVQVLTTAEKREDAQRIAAGVVERRLAGCAQVLGPITSTYWWQGRVEMAEEWLCLIKTRRSLYAPLEAAIRSLHPYEVPEILAVPVLKGHAPYLAWLDSVLKPNSGS
ncbi:MAG: divalent-cation tolerance protein CutA [Armatimonadetes bacterium]|nr:divalent-cation tolerance protein CutA [Armatimonadota bacterium]